MVVLLVLTAVTLITLDQRGAGGGVIGSLRDAARDAIAPVQTAVDDVFRPVTDWWAGVTDSAALKSENARLRRDLAAARGTATNAASALRENEDLKRIAQLPFTYGIPTVTTQIVGASPGNFESSVELDKGRAAGIVPGQPVVAGDGLVGRVTRASQRRATVLLLTDPSSEVGVRLANSNSPGVARGRAGSDLLELDFVDPDATVVPGELVVTAGLQNAVYPAGIPVARVVSVKKTPGDLSQTIRLRPLANVSRLEFLKVLKWTGGPVPAAPTPATEAPAGGG